MVTKKNIQNFNAALINEEIQVNNFYTNYTIGSAIGLGLFSQYYYAIQSDQNRRHLYFTSLYSKIANSPFIKAGINYQFISFKESRPNSYFSPNSYNEVSIFIDLYKNYHFGKNGHWKYGFNASSGFQYIEDNPKSFTYKIQGKLNYEISKQINAGIYGIKSTSAATTIAGYSYTEIGFRLLWQLKNSTPLINTKNISLAMN